MSMTVRYFWLEEGGSVHPIPRRRIVQIMNRSLAMPGVAGRAAKFVEAVVEFVDKKPKRLITVLGFLMHFDLDGRLDEEKYREGLRLAMTSVFAPDDPSEPKDKVRSITTLRAGQRLAKEHRFAVSRDEGTAITRLIWRGCRPERGVSR